MFSVTPKALYEAIYQALSDAVTLNYFKTLQKGFYPKSAELTNPNLYPWVFTEFGGFSAVDLVRFPSVWQYEFTIFVVAITMADRGDPTSLVFNDGTNEKKGVGDIVSDIGTVLWAQRNGKFGVSNVGNWTIARVGTPTVLGVQGLLLSPLVRGIQMDVVFDIRKQDTV